MRRVSLYAVLAAILCAFVSPRQSRADGIDTFTLSDGLGNTISWQLPASPTPLFVSGVSLGGGSIFGLSNVPAIVDGTAKDIDVEFANQTGFATFSGITGGRILASSFIQNGSFIRIISGAFFGTQAPQLYSGPESAPTFLTGIFSFPVQTQIFSPSNLISPTEVANNTNGTLTITPDVSPAPEPPTLVLLAAGLLGMGAIFLGKLP